MATKIKNILNLVPRDSVLFSSWLAAKGMDRKEQSLYVRSGDYPIFFIFILKR